MCGIAGYFGSLKQQPYTKDINQTLKIMKNRGEDGKSFSKIKVGQSKILNFLHTRLSIIDPKLRSGQPFQDEQGILIFNGMIYNYRTIKEKLKKKNIKFNTNSDTEVLLKFLNMYGPRKLNLLDGMWSFGYYNFKKKTLTISRDRFGEKPLYYFYDKSNFVFGSYYDYILNLYKNKKYKLNFKKVENFIKNSWKSNHIDNDFESFFKKIFFVKPGTCISIDYNNQLKEFKYWNPLKIQINNNLSFDHIKQKLKKEYKNVIQKRLISDYPIASLLSGGVDSSSIVSMSKKFFNKKLTCFSIDVKGEYDENKLINKTIKKYGLESNFIKIKKIISLI
jgi:asparagine synthase (glutamine-hydrolysing)